MREKRRRKKMATYSTVTKRFANVQAKKCQTAPKSTTFKSLGQRLYFTIYPLLLHITFTAHTWHSCKIISLINDQYSISSFETYLPISVHNFLDSSRRGRLGTISAESFRLLIASYSYLKNYIGLDIVQAEHSREVALPAQYKAGEEFFFGTQDIITESKNLFLHFLADPVKGMLYNIFNSNAPKQLELIS